LGEIQGKSQADPKTCNPDAGGKRNEACRRAAALALELGNVSEACRQCGLPRRTYYAWKKADDAQSASAGEADRIRSPHPYSVSGPRAQEVIAIALEFPEWGCDRIAYFLELKGRKLSSPTVQKILIRNGLGRASQRRARKEAS